MPNVLTIAPEQVETLQGSDGGAFRDFVNRIIHAQAVICNISPAAIVTDSRNVKDGGVDCEVKEGAVADPSGRLRNKSCWQYKATAHSRISNSALREEVRKSYVSKLIREGYAYRLCIADSLTAEKQSKWEKTLRDEIKKINTNAPDPQVLTSTSLATWASNFPAIVVPFTGVDGFFDLGAWGKSATKATPAYVPVLAWDGIAKQIAEHIDYSKPTNCPTFPVHADAGVGKTRLVYETLARVPSAKSLVLYTSDDQAAQNVAHSLAMQPDRHGILVIDECSQEARLKVEQFLRGNEHRLRVITIANYARTSIALEPTLQQMSRETVEKILEENFPDIPDERRRAAVSLAGGFVKIAADICQQDIPSGLMSAEQYYRVRIPDVETRKVVEAISLVTKIGFSGEVSGEFDELCKLTGLSPEDAKRRAKQLKDLPGFVGIGGRYFYVTPEAIAQIALQSAWVHWIQDNPAKFFERVPESLLQVFQARVARSGNNNFRTAMAEYFLQWSSQLRPADLDDKKKVEQLVGLIDTDPTIFLPVLVRLVEQATPEQLLANGGYWTEGWGPRRSLVWLCERLSGFPEHFYDVEKILFRLAQHESEKGIGNNASAVWIQLFALLLSGTSIPYVQRLKLLEQRLESAATTNDIQLILDALKGIFSFHYNRMVGPAIVAGRIPPPMWRPTTWEEQFESFDAAFALYEKTIESHNPILSEKALDAITQHVSWFLRQDSIDKVKQLLRPPRITTARLPIVLEQIDQFIRFEKRDSGQQSDFPADYWNLIIAWRESLIPNDFHSKLVSFVARPLYTFYDETEGAELKKRFGELAERFRDDKSLLLDEMEWLTSKEATAAGELGREIGRIDPDAKLFDIIVLATPAQNLAISRGYLLGMVQGHPQTVSHVNVFLDKLETANPELAFEYALTLPTEMNAFDRWIRLYDSGRIPAHHLQGLIYRLLDQITSDHLKKAIPRLLDALPKQPRAGGAVLSLVYQWFDQHKRSKVPLNLADADLWNLISEVVSQVIPSETMEVYYWTETMEVYLKINPKKATQIACALLNENLAVEEAANKILILLAAQHPELVMDSFGETLLKGKDSWRLEIRGVGGLLTSVPPEAVMKWLDKTSLEGGLKIASSLPRPFVNSKGEAVVPRLTELVLQRFEGNEKVTRRFVSGSGIRSYSGDIVGQRLKEANVAAKFLQHPISAIREWARIEKNTSEQEAARWKQEDAERFI